MHSNLPRHLDKRPQAAGAAAGLTQGHRGRDHPEVGVDYPGLAEVKRAEGLKHQDKLEPNDHTRDAVERLQDVSEHTSVEREELLTSSFCSGLRFMI